MTRRQPLSRERIRDTALALIDDAGLEGLSMRRLADVLGVQAASLYGHYDNKESVLDDIADLIIEKVDTSDFGAGWREGLRTWAHSYRAALSEHPRAVPIIASGTQRREAFLAMANEVHGGLTKAGWAPRRATEISGAIKYLVIGAASTPFASGFADDVNVYLKKYPHLTQAHRLSAEAQRIDDDSFELGLESFLRGLEPGPRA